MAKKPRSRARTARREPQLEDADEFDVPEQARQYRAEARRAGIVRVKAIKMGYFQHERRRVGDVFDVPEGNVNPSWMVRTQPRAPIQRTTGAQELKKQHDELLAAKTGADLTPTGDADPLGGEEATA